MGASKLMKERIRRVRVLFKELGCQLFDGEIFDESYSSGFSDKEGFHSGFYIDNDSRFLELVFTFTFSRQLASYVQSKLEEIILICYEYGCYMNINKEKDEIDFSVFSKIYYAGLNYMSLKETLTDFKLCIETIKSAVSIHDSISE